MINVIHLTHMDLDAMGCMLNLSLRVPVHQTKTFHTNYQDINDVVHNVQEFMAKDLPKLLLITDISFNQEKHLLQQLLSYQQQGVKVVFIDHHRYDTDFFNDLDGIIIHDEAKSATKLTQEFFKTHGMNASLDALSEVIDTFDIWQMQRPAFRSSITLNNYFWFKLNSMSIDVLTDKVIENNFKMLSDFPEFCKNNTANAAIHINKIKEKGLVKSDGFISLIFSDEFFNEILFEEFNKGVEFAIIANSYGIIRYRLPNISKVPDAIKLQIKNELLNGKNVGHLNAFSTKIQNHNFEKIMQEMERTVNIINKYKGQI